MEEYSQEIVDNIKHEPEVHFTCYLPEYPESDDEPEVKEVKIFVRKFDKMWKIAAKLFESYFVCGKCEYANKYIGEVTRHSKVCKTLKKCESCHLRSKSEKIKCVFCDQQFKCSNCKSIHIWKIHRKGSNWRCIKCDYRTLNRDCLKNHYQIHEKKFSCQTCDQKFSQKYQLKHHQQNHRHGDYATEAEITFECTKCVRSFATKMGLGQHEKNFHSKLKFQCDVCGKTKKTKTELRQHMQIHQKLSCPICHHFLAERRLQDHIEKHKTNPSFKCNSCDKFYVNLHDLNIHKSRIHEIEQVQCDLCQKIFKNKLFLRHHMKNYLKVSCPTCSKTMSKNSLYRHMKLHSSKQESLACNILYCKQKFTSAKELEEHKKIHAGLKSYKCPNCGHQSSTLQQFKSHMKCHQA